MKKRKRERERDGSHSHQPAVDSSLQLFEGHFRFTLCNPGSTPKKAPRKIAILRCSVIPILKIS